MDAVSSRFCTRRRLLVAVSAVAAGALALWVIRLLNPPEPPPETTTAVSADPLPDADPVRFLEMCIERYDREVQGYDCTFEKRERVAGKLQPREVTEAHFHERPFSVYLRWFEGAKKAERILYVEGQNADKMLVRPRGPVARAIVGDVVKRDVDGPEAKQSGRYTAREFGMKRATERALATWRQARESGRLQVEYRGVSELAEAGGRPCYQLHRTCVTPEDDGVREVTLYLDRENWLQVGSVLRGDGGKLIGEYFFRDIRLNPKFKPGQFLPAALKP